MNIQLPTKKAEKLTYPFVVKYIGADLYYLISKEEDGINIAMTLLGEKPERKVGSYYITDEISLLRSLEIGQFRVLDKSKIIISE